MPRAEPSATDDPDAGAPLAPDNPAAVPADWAIAHGESTAPAPSRTNAAITRAIGPFESVAIADLRQNASPCGPRRGSR
jgi:hypothetical protein